MHRQWYEFIDSPGTNIDSSYAIYHENHNKCYLFTDNSELKLAHLSTFLFDTKFVICRDRHLHIQKPNVGREFQ